MSVFKFNLFHSMLKVATITFLSKCTHVTFTKRAVKPVGEGKDREKSAEGMTKLSIILSHWVVPQQQQM